MDIEERLKRNNVKPTAMRVLVLKYLTEQTNAVSLSDIENAFENSDRITLYRTLKTFEENSLVHSIIDGTGITKYATCEEGCQCIYPQDIHLHFYCESCKRTFCMPKVKLPQVNMPKNFQLNEMDLIAKGICETCQSRNAIPLH